MGGLGLPLPLKLVPLPGLVLLEPRRTLGRRCLRAGVLPVEAAAALALALALEVVAAVADAEAEAAGVAASESSMASVAATSSRAAASTLAVLEARRIRIWSAE